MRDKNIRILAISFVMLFLEIALIRWIATEVRIFAYVSNLVLLACFLGIGLGAFFSGRRGNVLVTFGMLALIAVSARSEPFINITGMLGGFADSPVWLEAFTNVQMSLVLQGVALTLCMFCMILIAFVPIGQILGRLLDEHPHIIPAYSINIAAGLLGIWAFGLMSAWYTQPWLWFACALLMLGFFAPPGPANRAIAWAFALLTLLAAGVDTPGSRIVWSPYQKLEVKPSTYAGVENGYVVNVNNVGFMSLMDLSRGFVERNGGLYPPEMYFFNQYVLPYRFSKSAETVLIVGAGGGNDAAAAIRCGAQSIDAVEIDPGVGRLGRRLHPEKPYQNERVNLVIDDARAFFKKTRKRYDIIIFGLLDSHTLSSNYNNTRLDHYMYTLESFREARRLLKPDGILAVTFAAERTWIEDRLLGMLSRVFGEVPFFFGTKTTSDGYYWGGTVFVTGRDLPGLKARVAAQPDLVGYIARNARTVSAPVRPTTDDWPYLYIKKPAVPSLYACIIISLLVLFAAAAIALRSTGRGGLDLHFFFLGAAFMLLEFQNVSKADLLFGSTWVVNAYIISTILVLILMANLFAARFTIKSPAPYYLLLGVSLLINTAIPLDAYNALGYGAKAVIALTLLNLPIFFAGIVFIRSFASCPSKAAALGSNLLGAAVGGLLETLSFITGIRALLVVVMVLYLAAYVCKPKLSGRK